ncbi:MAG: alpha/beta fold hydrolase [Chloroflexales bacterium]|nr:alpha/beta fold hydrolase [Chloroflexales bacterium]
MRSWTENDVSTNGIRLHYQRGEAHAKPALVLLHGITDSGLCWAPVAQDLAGDYDVIMVDARGHGQSDAPTSGYAAHDHAADVIGLLDALNLDRPALLGHSMGATTAAAVASTVPDRVACVLLEDPPWRLASEANTPEQNEAFAAQWRADVLEQKAKSREELIAGMRGRWPEAELGPWADAKRQVSPHVMGFVTAPALDWSHAVVHISAPLLLITGATAIVGDEVAQEVLRRAPNAQRAHIAGAGHNIRRDQFAAYMVAVRAFLREHAGQPFR